VTATDPDGAEQPVMHACGHDVHVTCLIGCARLMAQAKVAWRGTFVALFQPSEENGDGADAMIDDGLTSRVPRPDVVLAQHVLPYPAGYVGTRPGSFLSAADSLRITVHGRGAHGSMPQAAVDPVVMAAMIVVRLQTVVSRELAATTPAVLTVGSIHAGSGPNVIPDSAVIQLNVRTYDDASRTQVMDAIERIVTAECEAARAPRAPEIDRISSFPPTVNDPAGRRCVRLLLRRRRTHHRPADRQRGHE
jgi:hippurate hydrolase